MRMNYRNAARWIFRLQVLGWLLVGGGAALRAEDSAGVHTPGPGSEERSGILDALHAEYTTGSGSAVKFKVLYLKAHAGWAWIKVLPLDRSGTAEGEEWPSLLRREDGEWSIVDMSSVAADDDQLGALDPSRSFLRRLRQKFPSLPADILPAPRED